LEKLREKIERVIRKAKTIEFLRYIRHNNPETYGEICEALGGPGGTIHSRKKELEELDLIQIEEIDRTEKSSGLFSNEQVVGKSIHKIRLTQRGKQLIQNWEEMIQGID